MSIVVGSRAAGRHGTVAVAEILHHQQPGSKERDLTESAVGL